MSGRVRRGQRGDGRRRPGQMRPDRDYYSPGGRVRCGQRGDGRGRPGQMRPDQDYCGSTGAQEAVEVGQLHIYNP